MNKTIWMLWYQGYDQAPALVQACIRSWIKQNPGWDVRVFTKQDVEELFVSPADRAIVKKMSVQALSDFLRMELLSKHGGVWADATAICAVPLDNWLHDMMAEGFFALRRPWPDKPIASWFLAAEPGNYIVNSWLGVTKRVWSQDTVQGVDGPRECRRLKLQIPQKGKVWLKGQYWRTEKKLPYFWAHYLFDALIHQDKKFQQIWEEVPALSAKLGLRLRDRISPANKDFTVKDLEKFLSCNISPLFKLNRHLMDPDTNPKARLILDYYAGADESAPSETVL